MVLDEGLAAGLQQGLGTVIRQRPHPLTPPRSENHCLHAGSLQDWRAMTGCSDSK